MSILNMLQGLFMGGQQPSPQMPDLQNLPMIQNQSQPSPGGGGSVRLPAGQSPVGTGSGTPTQQNPTPGWLQKLQNAMGGLEIPQVEGPGQSPMPTGGRAAVGRGHPSGPPMGQNQTPRPSTGDPISLPRFNPSDVGPWIYDQLDRAIEAAGGEVPARQQATQPGEAQAGVGAGADGSAIAQPRPSSPPTPRARPGGQNTQLPDQGPMPRARPGGQGQQMPDNPPTPRARPDGSPQTAAQPQQPQQQRQQGGHMPPPHRRDPSRALPPGQMAHPWERPGAGQQQAMAGAQQAPQGAAPQQPAGQPAQAGGGGGGLLEGLTNMLTDDGRRGFRDMMGDFAAGLAGGDPRQPGLTAFGQGMHGAMQSDQERQKWQSEQEIAAQDRRLELEQKAFDRWKGMNEEQRARAKAQRDARAAQFEEISNVQEIMSEIEERSRQGLTSDELIDIERQVNNYGRNLAQNTFMEPEELDNSLRAYRDERVAAVRRAKGLDPVAAGGAAGGGGGDGSSMGSPANPQSQQEFDSLPSGAYFVNPADGRILRKK